MLAYNALMTLSTQPTNPTQSATAPTLLQQVRAAIRARHYSLRTEEAYAAWVKRYVLLHRKRHPAEMGPAEITQFLTALAVERRFSASTQNQALAALLFLYRDVLGRVPGWLEGVVRAQRPKRLPVVLTRGEVERLLHALSGVAWVMGALYGSGLRLTECLRLRVKDLDFTRHEIFVRDGKGQKDRVTMLPHAVAPALISYLERVRRLHDADRRTGGGRVALPDALERKYPNAALEWAWQLFPPPPLSMLPRETEEVREPFAIDASDLVHYGARDGLKMAG
jgi:integron integrase